MSDEIFRLLLRFINDMNLTQPEYNFSEQVWRFPMRFGPNPKDWTMVYVTLYEKTYYCYWSEWDLSLELSTKGKIKKPAYWSLSDGDSKKFSYMLTKLTTVVKRITNDLLRVYRETLKDLPLDMRYGIIPKFVLNHRASQNFEKGDRVFDCAHLHDFSRKNRILPFISWKPIDPIRPRIV